MGRAALLVAALWCGAIPALAQQASQTSDTVLTTGVVLLDPGIALGKPVLLFPPSYQPGSEILPARFVKPFAASPPLFLLGPPGSPKADLLSPYVLELRRSQKMNTFYTILGAMELGAVAYIAYRHVKKFGF